MLRHLGVCVCMYVLWLIVVFPDVNTDGLQLPVSAAGLVLSDWFTSHTGIVHFILATSDSTTHTHTISASVTNTHTHTHTHPFNGPFSGTTRVSRYQKGKTTLDFTEARDSGSGISRAICKSAPRSRQITTPAPHCSVFLQAGCPSCHPTNGVKALKANSTAIQQIQNNSTQFGSVPETILFNTI